MIGCKLQVSEKGVSVFCMYSACEACEVWQKKKEGDKLFPLLHFVYLEIVLSNKELGYIFNFFSCFKNII